MMLNMAANGRYRFDFLCPTILTVCNFFLFLLASASFLNITVIAVDRLYVIYLHLRYQELVTPKCVIITLVSLWLTSAVSASIFVSLRDRNRIVVVIMGLVGIPFTTVAYILIYKVVRHHQNQIRSHLQLQNVQTMELVREKKSALNALFVYVVFIVCYLPYLCCEILLITNSSRISFWAADHAAFFFLLLNSSLNPLLYCWRYQEMRQIVKNTLKKILRITDS